MELPSSSQVFIHIVDTQGKIQRTVSAGIYPWHRCGSVCVLFYLFFVQLDLGLKGNLPEMNTVTKIKHIIFWYNEVFNHFDFKVKARY